jgi:hypothetical protein
MFVDRLGTEKVLIFSAKDIFSIAGDGLAISNSVRLQKKLLLNI